MAGELTIEQNTDGTATINFAGVGVYGGGSHTVGQAGDNVADNVAALKAAYKDRIGNIVSSELTGEAQISNNTTAAQAIEAAGTDTTTSTTTEQTGLSLDPKYAQYVGQSEGRVIDGIEIPYWVDDDYITSYVYSAKQGNPRGPNNREMTELLAGVPIEQLYETTDRSYWSNFTTASSELLYSSAIRDENGNDTRDWNTILQGVTSGQEAYTKSWNATTNAFLNQELSPFVLERDGIPDPSGGYRVNANGEYIDSRQPMTWGLNSIKQFGNLIIKPADPYGLGASGVDNGLMMGVTSNNGIGFMEVTTDPSVLWKFGVSQDDINAAREYLKTTYDFDNNYTRFTATNKLRDFFNATKNYNVTNAAQLSYQSLFSNFKPFVPSTTGTVTNTTSTNTMGTTGTTQQQQQDQQQETSSTSNVVTQPIQAADQLPQTISYQMPQGYQGSSFMPTYMSPTGTGMQMAPMTGTFTQGITSAFPNQTGQTYMMGNNLQQQTATTAMPQYDVRMYRNNAGMTVSITFVDGKPSTPIPSGFYPVDQQPAGQMPFQPQVPTTPAPTVTPVQGYNPVINNPVTAQPFTPQFNMAQGGIVPELPKPSGKKFGGFKPEAQERIAQSLGYTGDMEEFDKFLEENPEKKEEMDKYTETAKQMAEGGYIQKFSNGGDPQSTTVSMQQYDPRVLNQQYIPQQANLAPATYTGNLTNVMSDLARTPALPLGSTVVPLGTQLEQGQIVSPYSGQVAGSLALPTALASTQQTFLPNQTQANMMSPVEASGAVSAAANQTQAAQLQQVAQINAAQNVGTSVANVEAAQGTGILMNNPVQRKIESDPVTGESELISGVANAETAAKFNEEIQAATATPTKQATVAGQLETLMTQFEGGATPSWAAGAMRTATATMSARGLGASSLAGQAIVQAAMEAALPIAQMDAQVTSQFEQMNLSNRQQRAILAAQQRAQFMGMEFDQGFQARVANAAKISDIANMNFTAEQQVALENSRIANTMELTNLSNSQAMIMAEAAALANMDMSNLNNRQQAAVQNAQNFLQADLTNLNNKQSTELFKAQQRIQSLFTDQAALNAAQQFNATSQNQTDQFFAQLQTNTAQFNASQANAQAQFNAGQVNVIERFNAEINNQRDQFNAANRLVIDQANAQWRRQIATADTAAANRANEINAQALLGYSQTAYNNLWQYYADNMEWAWTSAENERKRLSEQAIAHLRANTELTLAEFQADAQSSAGLGGLIGKIFTSDLDTTLGGSIIGNMFDIGG